MSFRTRTTIIGIVIAVSVLLPPWPSLQNGSAAAQPTLIFAMAADADTLDCPLTLSNQSAEVCLQIFNGLVRNKPGTVEIEPDLATRWSVSPDGLVWTFTLRNGVTFQDGTPWNSAAAKVNIDRWADKNDPTRPPGAAFVFWDALMASSFKEARALDPHTLQLVLDRPDSPLLANLAIPTFAFASPVSLRAYGGASAGQHPVGTGPFKFVDWVRGDHISLQANPAFFRTGLPRTQRVVYRVITDSAARYLALKAGEVDVIENADLESLQNARRDPHLKVGMRPALSTVWIEFDFNRPGSPFKDIRVRRAVALAINKDAIVRGLYGELGEAATQFLPPMLWGRAPGLTGYPYDPTEARRLLAEAYYPNGFDTDFWYLPVARPYSPASKDLGTAVANALGRVGIRTHLVTEDFAAYIKDAVTTTKFPIFMLGRTGLTGDPDDWFGPVFGRYNPLTARWSYNNPTVVMQVRTAEGLASQPLRAKVYENLETILFRDVALIPLAYAKSPLLMRSTVDGLVPQPTTFEYLESVVVNSR